MKPHDIAAVVAALVRELATEIDMHYDDEEFFALRPTIDALEAGCRALKHLKFPEPDVMNHVRQRFQRASN